MFGFGKPKRTGQMLSILPGGAQQLDRFANDLSMLLNNSYCDNNFIKFSDKMITAIYVRATIMGMEDEQISTTVKINLKDFGCKFNDEMPLKIIYLYKLHKSNPIFTLRNEKHLELLNSCFEVDHDLFNLDSILLNRDMKDLDGKTLWFNSNEEFLLFAIHNKNVGVRWNESQDFKFNFETGYNLVGSRLFKPALKYLKKCFSYNPVGLIVRHEIMECLLGLKQNELALKFLLDMKDYIFSEQDIAWFYRRSGYILIELQQYELASACLKYSLQFANADMAKHEIEYIEKKFNVFLDGELVKPTLLKNQFPLLVVKSLNDIIELAKKNGLNVETTK